LAWLTMPASSVGFMSLAALLLLTLAQDVGGRPYPDFGHALEFEHVIHAVARSAREGARVAVAG
jgi:hypothetical protein